MWANEINRQFLKETQIGNNHFVSVQQGTKVIA